MPTESFKTLEAGIEAWNRRDIDRVIQNLSEDIVWVTGGQIPDIDPLYEGHDGVRRFVQIYRYDQRHLCREFRAFAEEDEQAARSEAGL